MTITLTREVLDKSIAGLRQADAEGRPQIMNTAMDPETGAVCACWIILEANDVDLSAETDSMGVKYGVNVYKKMIELGFTDGERHTLLSEMADKPHYQWITQMNDVGRSFAEIADMLETFPVCN